MNQQNERILGTAALFKANYFPDDYISTYIPFIVNILHKTKIERTDVNFLVKMFAAEYGFSLPREPMIEIIRKCLGKGIFKRELDHELLVDRKVVDGLWKNPISNDPVPKLKQLVASLIVFSKEKFDRVISETEAEESIILFLKENSTKTISFSVKEDDYSLSDRQLLYLVSQYVIHVHKCVPIEFSYFLDLSLAIMISSSISFNDFSDLRKKTQYNDLIVYLDTPIMFRVLGLHTEEMTVSSRLLIDKLVSMNAKIRIFEHTYEEIKGILNDACYWIDKSDYNPDLASLVANYFHKKSYGKSEIMAFIGKIDELLKQLNIYIDDQNYFAEQFKQYQIDASTLTDLIVEVYSNNGNKFNYENKKITIEYDVRSISNILKLWKRHTYRNYSEAKYIFVTNNNGLAYSTRKIDLSNNPSKKYGLYPAMTDVFLGTEIWLSSPIDQLANYSEIKLMADCMGFIEPNGRLVGKVMTELDKMKEDKSLSAEDYEFLKQSCYEDDYLQNRTLNDENAYSDEIAEEFIENAKQRILKPVLGELESVRTELGIEREQLNTVKELLQSELSKKEYRKQEIEKKLRESEIEYRKVLDRIFRVCLIFAVILDAMLNLSSPDLLEFSTIERCAFAFLAFIIGLYLVPFTKKKIEDSLLTFWMNKELNKILKKDYLESQTR